MTVVAPPLDFMVTVGITNAITNLNAVHALLEIAPSVRTGFFEEWKEPLPPLTEAEETQLDRLKQRYFYYAEEGSITEGTVNLILLAPLLETLGLFDPPFQVRSEKYVRFMVEDGDRQLEGLIDALLLQERLWLIVIESKRYGFSVRQALPQTLGYMAGTPSSPIFALITTGEDYLFVKLDRTTAEYALSDKLTLSTVDTNELHRVAQILKHLVQRSSQSSSQSG